MDNLPYDNPEQLVYCLQATFKGSSNEEVSKATEVLHRMSKDIIRFANSLMNIVIHDHTDEKNLNIKNSACLALSSLLVNMAREEIISIEQKGCLLEIILNTMFARDVALALKITLQSALQELYSVDKEQELRNKSLQIISHKLNNGAIEDYSAAFLVLQCVIKTPGTHKENLSKWFIGLRDSLLTSSTNLINGIVEEIKEAMGSQNHNEKFNNVFVGLKILKIWISTLKIYIDLLGKPTSKKSKTIHSTHIQHIISQESIVNVLSTVLTLQIPTEKQLPQCLFSTSGVTGVDQALNGVKAQVIKCFNKVLEFVFKSKALLNQTLNKFFAFSSNMGVQGVLQSVFMLCESPAINLEEAMMDQDMQDCMVESLIFLSHLTSYNHLYQLFSNFHKRLIMNVCIPLLRTTPSELEKFERNPSEFVSIAVDTCDEQHSRIAKAQAANLLEHLCDNIDGAVSFTTIAVIAIIDYSLQFNTLEVIPEKYTTLNEYKEGLFISKTDVKIRIETCLVVLCNISYLISKRKDLIEPVENLFINYREMFYNDKADPLIRVRMCLIVSYFFEVLFQRQSQKEHLAMQLRLVVEALDVYNHEGLRAIAEQAVDALCNIFLQDNLRPKLREYLPEVVDKLASHIRVTDNVGFFDIIEELFTNYTKRLISTPNLIAVLIDAMVKRIQTECQAKERSEKVQDIIFNKIWNIFREISQDPQFIPTHQEDIEKLMTPLFAYLEREQRAPFEEEIMAYVTSVTKVSKHVSSSCWKIFKTFPSIFLRCKKLLSSVFPALNQIIIYGQETLRKDQASLQELVEMAIQGLNPSHNQATEANVSEACLLMHLIFQYLDTISNSDWERMLIACLERSKGVKRSYLQTRLGGVFLCSFVANFKLTWSILSNQNRISDLLNLYIGEAANFEHPYDRKVLLLGLSAICMNGFTDPAIYERLLHIFNVLISFLKYVEYKDKVDKGGDDTEFKRKDRKMTNKEILQEFLSMKYAGNYRSKQDRGEIEHEDVNQANTDDENDGGVKSDEDSDAEADSGDDTCLMHTDEAEAKATLETLETDWLAKDEFVIFKNVVYTLRHQNEAMIVELVNQLPMSKKEILNEVLNSQRITVDIKGGKAETEARKIVKTKTRKIATNLDLNNQ